MSPRAWYGPRATRCKVCGERRRTERHHVLKEQLVRREHGDIYALANRLDICSRCHGRHTSAVQRIELGMLPDAAFEFASALLGPGCAYNRLRAEYAGDDPRLDALAAAHDALA